MRNGGGKRIGVTSYVCRRAHGPPPPGKPQAAHLCRNKLCINQAHLLWSSNFENNLDEIIARMTPAHYAALGHYAGTALARRLAQYPAYLRGNIAARLVVLTPRHQAAEETIMPNNPGQGGQTGGQGGSGGSQGGQQGGGNKPGSGGQSGGQQGGQKPSQGQDRD
jgi:uncharacterized membrane protein YgcG